MELMLTYNSFLTKVFGDNKYSGEDSQRKSRTGMGNLFEFEPQITILCSSQEPGQIILFLFFLVLFERVVHYSTSAPLCIHPWRVCARVLS